MKSGIWLVAMAAAIWAASVLPGRSDPVRDRHVEAELIAEDSGWFPGSPLWIGLRLRMDPGWHTYWKNPGDAGLPTRIDWDLPDGFAAGPIHWPVPLRFVTGGIVSYGYSDEIVLLSEITPPTALTVTSDVTVVAKVEWLMCEEICIPGGVTLELALPVLTAPGLRDPPHRQVFAAARRRLAEEETSWRMTAWAAADRIHLRLISEAEEAPIPDSVYLFPFHRGIDPNSSQEVVSLASGVEFQLRRTQPPGDDLSHLEGVVSSPDGWLIEGKVAGIAVDVPLQDGEPPPEMARLEALPTSPAIGLGGTLVLFLAFAGGLILNLMPCVFPVLGLKIMGFVNRAGEAKRRVKLHGLVFTMGVLLSFWALALILIGLRAGGEELGWGFQLQSPGFVFALSALLLVFALNLAGVFEIGGSLIGVGSGFSGKFGMLGSFATGVLATVVATPCAAPFLAPALGAALTMPPLDSLLVFTAMALGLSCPYLLLSLFPAAIRLLPRPGAWMETFRQAMAFPLLATVAFLIWVLAGQLDEGELLHALLALVAIAMGCWIYGRWSIPVRSFGTRLAARLAAASLLLGSLYMAFGKAPDINWEKWSPELVARYREEGRHIYVDFTARWCATCQTNKKLLFSSSPLLRRFREQNVATLKADWTLRDPRITHELELFGRSAVPFNLLYLPGRQDPIELPVLLTPGTVLEAMIERHP